ncbi:glutathione S-transferase family protein [Vibrio sp. T187]|uniref:glutathione S-transferase family protein n=1 Tax=Vibrio TaxID=662 RepID=UPI0010C9DFA1|nr:MULTISPECIES: glutathione S-transferase family protein [Vibrio]MBW3698474.1 glutathione S-transferase family protein [Vibrio sp. T187]
MIKVVSFKICPFVQRVTAALEAKQIPYEIEYISLSDKPQWFLDVSPNGQVPILITESGTTLFESDAIIEYIEDEFGPLENNVTNEQRALDRAWSYLGSKHYLAQCGTMSSKNGETFAERSEKLIKAFKKAEDKLSGDTQFFKSNELSNVDMAWIPLLHRAAIVKEKVGYDFLCGLPKMQAWQKNLLETGLVEKSVSEDFVELFSNFYLANTYLAEGKDIQQQGGCGSTSCCG